MVALPLVLALLAQFARTLQISESELFNFAAGLVAFLFIVVVVLVFIFIYDNLRKERKTATATA
jgi:uncharacterized membrane protein